MYPSYAKLHEEGRLAARAIELRELMKSCSLCPRNCGANRCAGETGQCLATENASIYSHEIDHGEEPPISGDNGSGKIYFAFRPQLRSCAHSPKLPIGKEPMEVSTAKLANIMLYLQEEECHNINLVMPAFHIPMIVEALDMAAAKGLRIPVIYNSDAFENMQVLKLLDGVVDIYIPEILFSDDQTAIQLGSMENYKNVSREALKEMYAQTGNLIVNGNIAEKGLVVRHMVLPGGMAGTHDTIPWIADNISTECFVSILGNYQPSMDVVHPRVLNRDVSVEEYEEAILLMKGSGLNNGWFQQGLPPQPPPPQAEEENRARPEF